MGKLTAPLIAAALMFPLLAADAIAEDWVVTKVSGKAWLVTGQGAATKPLSAGMTVPEGATVQTSENARAMLLRGRDAMVVAPRSVLAVQTGRGAGSTTVLQRSGQITLEVETQQAPHFTVETPFMAAVVKGTKFDVKVSGRDANVSVQRGRVQVADFATGQTADITPGQRAGVRAGKPGLTLAGRGRMPTIQAGQPRAAVVPPIGRADAVQPPSAGAAKSSDAAAGFGPGRSWSGSASLENRSEAASEHANGGRGKGTNALSDAGVSGKKTGSNEGGKDTKLVGIEGGKGRPKDVDNKGGLGKKGGGDNKTVVTHKGGPGTNGKPATPGGPGTHGKPATPGGPGTQGKSGTPGGGKSGKA